MSRLTLFLARLIGLFSVLLVTALLVHGSAAVAAAATDASVMLTYGIISLAIGVAMVLGHNVWSGGALPVIVTLVGWLILAKGLLLLLLPPDTLVRFLEQMHYGEHFGFYLVPALAIGLYLIWAARPGTTSEP